MIAGIKGIDRRRPAPLALVAGPRRAGRHKTGGHPPLEEDAGVAGRAISSL